MDKEQVLLAQMLESWKDVRSYGSLVWQITGLSLATIGVVISQAVGGSYNGEPILTSSVGVLLLLFAVFISLIAISGINWLFGNVITRADMIHQMEARFHDFDFELYSPQLEKIPSKGTFGFGVLIIYEWKELPLMLGVLFEVIAGVAILSMQNIWFQLSLPLFGTITVGLFNGFLFIILFYTLDGSRKLRNRYVEVFEKREFKRIEKKYDDIEQ